MALVNNSYLHRVISGEQRGSAPALIRGVLRGGEFFYSAATAIRNKLYDRGVLRAHRLPVRVISVGNITAGGTGKTPVVRYLAGRMRESGLSPAIIMRGYHKTRSGFSDEQLLLSEQLAPQNIPVHAQPDRVAGGWYVIRSFPQIDLLLLDDGFQHRRLARDVDIVLIDASNPLGYDHVHPRGLLRESPKGLSRATAILLTRCEELSPPQLEALEKGLRRYNTSGPIFRSRFAHSGLRSAGTPIEQPADIALNALKSRRPMLAAGVGNPEALLSSLRTLACGEVARIKFQDHHDYTANDLVKIRRFASESRADVIITTEKDWVKLRSLPGAMDGTPPIWRLDLQIKFDGDDEEELWDLLRSRIERPQENRPPQADNSGEDQNRQNHPDAGP